MTVFIVSIATIALMTFITALFVAGEFATVASRKTRVSQLAATGNPLARQLLVYLDDRRALDRYVAACQLGITLASLLLGAYGQNVLADYLVQPITMLSEYFGERGWQLLSVSESVAESVAAATVLILLTMLLVIVGELLPKSVAIQYPERLAMAVVWPIRWSIFIFGPLIRLFNGSGNLVLRLLGTPREEAHGHAHSAAEIEILVTESHEGGLLDSEERQMLRNAFRMRDLTAREVMAHRTRIVAAPVESTVRSLLEVAIEAGHTRIPLYRQNVDEIMGFVHIKDLFRLHVNQDENLASILRDVVYVPEAMPVVDLWQKLQEQRQYMAVVFDEYGGTAGLVTLEDLIEEIFGEVQDEFDDETALMTIDQEGHRVHLRGDLLISDVNEYLNLNLPDDEAVTLSGLVLSALGRVPEVGDLTSFVGTEIRVEAMEDQAVLEVSVEIASNEQFPHIDEWESDHHE